MRDGQLHAEFSIAQGEHFQFGGLVQGRVDEIFNLIEAVVEEPMRLAGKTTIMGHETTLVAFGIVG